MTTMVRHPLHQTVLYRLTPLSSSRRHDVGTARSVSVPAPRGPALATEPLRHVAQMAHAFSQVQAVLGTDSPISDKQIRDALWDSYFDVDGSIAHLLGNALLTFSPHNPPR